MGQVNQVDFLAPRAAVVVGFDSDAVLVLTEARGRWFFPFFDRVEFWLRRQARSLRFFQFFTRFHQVDFLAPRAAVALGFDSDALLVPMEARGRWFFPVFVRVEFWLRRQPRTCRFFQFFTRWNDQVERWIFGSESCSC